ncbi:hypothetical protein X770_05640 [Mesorhizobium sp. LSJC269B00]|nr:hypothetical protein X770_05640 [Mesorhizobium sp. LSJC269B00]
MLLAVHDAMSTAVLAGRSANAEIVGVVDLTNKAEVDIGITSLGRAIQFVANASVLGYDIRGAMVLLWRARYPEPKGERVRALVGAVWRRASTAVALSGRSPRPFLV